MKAKLCFILLFASLQIVNAQPPTANPAPSEQPKSTMEKAGDLIDAAGSIWKTFKKPPKQTAPQQTSAPQQTVAVKTPQQEANPSEPPQETTIPAPTRKKSQDQPTDVKPTEPPVANTSGSEIEEMPDLATKKHDGVQYSVKQWQQVGQKIIIKMIIENKDVNAPMKQIHVNGQENTIYASDGSVYKGSITRVATFVSKDGELATVPIVFGAKSSATVEFNVGNAKISKVVGLNFMFLNYYGNHYHFFTIP